MRGRWISAIGLGLAAGGLLFTQSVAAPEEGMARAEIGKPAPDFKLKEGIDAEEIPHQGPVAQS